MWQQFIDLPPTYSGYAWVTFQDNFTKGKPWWPARMCKIWPHTTDNQVRWGGWDFESDEPLNIKWAPCKVMLINKPE